MTRSTNSPDVALLGEAPPRVLVRPEGERSNGWEDVADLSAMLGVTLLPWQELVLDAAMGEQANGTWAAKRVGVSVPRQNGKSQLLVARALAGALIFGERLIVVSAHQQDTARETFEKLLEIVEADENQGLRDRLAKNGVMNAFGRESVKFKNGAKIKFKARSGAGGKGFSSDCLLLDEAQILGSRAWTSINSTMSARANPQVWLLGTPPQDEDDCYTFDMVRKAAMSGKSTASAWVEWGADPDAADFDPASELTRWQANPSWNSLINHEVVQGEYETYTPERFAQDRLGIWRQDAGAKRLITPAQWSATATTTPPDESEGVRTIAVSFTADGLHQAVAGAVKTEDGGHVELIGAYSGRADVGVAQLADWIAERRHRIAEIAILGRAGSGVLAEALRERGVPKPMIHIMSTGEYFGATSMFLDAVREKHMTHPKGERDDLLNRAVATCDKRLRGQDGAWGWAATIEDGDPSPLDAASAAYWIARTTRRRPRALRGGNAQGRRGGGVIVM